MIKMSEMPDVLQKAYEMRAPNHICEYAYTLARGFQDFVQVVLYRRYVILCLQQLNSFWKFT